MFKISKQISLILLSGVLCSSGNLYASAKAEKQGVAISQQTTTLKGNVQDAMGPIIGASVVVKGTTNGMITDMDGNFTLEVKKGDIIQISYVGYLTQEIKYNGEPVLNITLKDDTQKLEEIVVVGYGTEEGKPYRFCSQCGQQINGKPTDDLCFCRSSGSASRGYSYST